MKLTVGERITRRHPWGIRAELAKEVASTIDRAISRAAGYGWSMGIMWEAASRRGDLTKRDALYEKMCNYNRKPAPKRRLKRA